MNNRHSQLKHSDFAQTCILQTNDCNILNKAMLEHSSDLASISAYNIQRISW